MYQQCWWKHPRPERSFSSLFDLHAAESLARACLLGRATLESHLTLRTASLPVVFHGDELRTLVEKNDWEGIESPSDPPERNEADLNKPDAAAARAKAAGGFSDARVLPPIFCRIRTDGSLNKTWKMQAAVVGFARLCWSQSVARQGLGEGDFAWSLVLCGKKLSQTELSFKAREYYVAGGTKWE
jgi:hypothetical protein